MSFFKTINFASGTRFPSYLLLVFEAGRGAAARGVTVKSTGCGFDPYSRR